MSSARGTSSELFEGPRARRAVHVVKVYSTVNNDSTRDHSTILCADIEGYTPALLREYVSREKRAGRHKNTERTGDRSLAHQ